MFWLKRVIEFVGLEDGNEPRSADGSLAGTRDQQCGENRVKLRDSQALAGSSHNVNATSGYSHSEGKIVQPRVLFRWVRNGFRTDEVYEQSATPAEKAARKAEDSRRWQAGVAMYSTVD
jgi:hypothetical protein